MTATPAPIAATRANVLGANAYVIDALPGARRARHRVEEPDDPDRR